MFVELSLNVRVKHFERSSQCPYDTSGSPDPDKTMPVFLSEVYREFGAKIIEIKVAEMNTALN